MEFDQTLLDENRKRLKAYFEWDAPDMYKDI